MTANDSLSAFPITRKWPARHPDRIQYYGLPTPNGVKVSTMLEECGLPYEAHRIAFDQQEQKSPEFLSLNPNGKIPAIIDPAGPGGAPLGLFESGAILLYLADKTGKFLGNGAADRWHAIQWLMFQMGGVGPMFGQVGFYVKFAGKDWAEPRSKARYVAEAQRLLGVMDAALAGKDWFLGEEYSIADIAMLGMVRNLTGFYEAGDVVDFNRFENVSIWLTRGLERPAVQRGLTVCA